LKKILILFLLCSVAFAKKDFYYSFINDQKGQMEQNKKDEIIRGSDRLNYIKRLVRENRLDDAYEEMVKFRGENKLKVLESSIELLYAEILNRRGSKKFAVEGAKVLELAINNSTIVQSDLLDALRLLVRLEVRINKVKEARFYAKSIGESFDDPLAKAYGKIAQAHIDTHRRNYKKAIKTLYKILVNTKSMEVATIVADELYDVYVLSGEHEKAHNLATKVLEKNIEYYANDSYLALKKVDKLVRADMPHLAIKILKKLLENAKEKKLWILLSLN
jgi:tetratricopeptide (TPR) repeat protein